MKNILKILALILTISILTTIVGCSFFNKSNHNTSSNNSISLDEKNTSSTASTESDFNSDEASSDSENSSSENQDLGSNSSNVSSDTSSVSTSSKPATSSNTSSTTSKPTTNTSSSNTSSTMSWKEEMESYGYEVLFDENVKLYYRTYDDDYIYEAKYDGINTERDSDYSNWDPMLKMYYVISTQTITYYDGGWHGYTDSNFWDEKYRNGYWKVEYKYYTDGTEVKIRDYEYDEDTTYDSSLCEYCGKKEGNGTNGTCSQNPLCHRDWKCNLCGAIVKKYACHSCPDHIVSDELDVWGKIE